jgi:chitinase
VIIGIFESLINKENVLGYDVPAIGKYLDYVSVMTYDFHGHWDKKTGHVAPMYVHPDDDFYFFNAVSLN